MPYWRLVWRWFKRTSWRPCAIMTTYDAPRLPSLWCWAIFTHCQFFHRSGLLFIGNTPILGWCNEIVGSVSNDIWEQQKCGRERVNYLFFLILLWCVGYVNSKQICSSMNSFRLFAWLYINMVKADKKYIVFHCKHNINKHKTKLVTKTLNYL